jgi:hypothetical protein
LESRVVYPISRAALAAARNESPAMTLTDASSTALLPSRALGLIAALPPVLIVAGAAALGYTQGPKLGPTLSGLFAPPPVAAYHAPQPPIDNTPVAKIAPEPPPPAPQAPVVATPQPLPVVHPVKHAAKKTVARAPHVKVVYVNPAPQPRYVYPVYRSYQPAYTPVPLPIPIPFGGRGGRMLGGFGGLFGRH